MSPINNMALSFNVVGTATNLNDLRTPGEWYIYRTPNTATTHNDPPFTTGGVGIHIKVLMGRHATADPTNCIQMCWRRDSSQVWIRHRTSTDWAAWTQLGAGGGGTTAPNFTTDVHTPPATADTTRQEILNLNTALRNFQRLGLLTTMGGDYANFNTYTNPGTYTFNNVVLATTVLNRPPVGGSGNGRAVLHVTALHNGAVLQEFRYITTDTNHHLEVWVRARRNTTSWSNWINLAVGGGGGAHDNHTGDVTSTGLATTIANGVVTNAKLANIANANRIKGRIHATTQTPVDLTPEEVMAILGSTVANGAITNMRYCLQRTTAGNDSWRLEPEGGTIAPIVLYAGWGDRSVTGRYAVLLRGDTRTTNRVYFGSWASRSASVNSSGGAFSPVASGTFIQAANMTAYYSTNTALNTGLMAFIGNASFAVTGGLTDANMLTLIQIMVLTPSQVSGS
jgi:hypothetical protein